MSDRCQECSYLDHSKYLCDPADPNVCAPCKQLMELDKKIKDLMSECRKLNEQANHNHDQLIHCLPLEIVADTFAFCIPEDPMDIALHRIEPESRLRICAPLVLSAVCRQWRTIAHSAPQLWQTLFLCSEASSSRVFPRPLSIQKWIDRAGLLPLSISLYVKYNQIDPGIRVIPVLNRCANRWLELKYDGFSQLLGHLSGGGQDLPQLRTLHLKNPLNSFKENVILRPKQLHSLSISRIQLAQINFNWQHLKQLEIGQVPLSECFEALCRAPSLMHYTLLEPRGEPILLLQNPAVQPNLHYLRFAAWETPRDIIQEIFEQLLFPSLTTLIFDSVAVKMTLIIDLLWRSGCSLETFSLGHANLSVPDLATLCQGIPTLQNLHIGFMTFWSMSSLFALLAEFLIVNGRKQPRYLPALRSFGLVTPMVRDGTTWAPTINHWMMLPNIFGAPAAHIPEATERHRHGLESIKISMKSRAG